MTKIRMGLGLLGLSLLTAGCTRQIKMDTRQALDPDPTLTASKTDPLIMTLRIFRVPDPIKEPGKGVPDHPIAEGEALHNGDAIYFALRLSQPAYVYLVLFGPDGSFTTFLPTTQYQLAPARCMVRVPGGAKPILLGAPTGLENLRLVASLRPLPEVDRHLCEELRLNCDLAALPAQPTVAPCAAVGLRGIVPAVKTTHADSNGIAQTRFSLRHDP